MMTFFNRFSLNSGRLGHNESDIGFEIVILLFRFSIILLGLSG